MKPISLKLIGNQLIRKLGFTDLEYNTKLIVNLGVVALVYKNNTMYDYINEGERILNPYKGYTKKNDPSEYLIYLINKNHRYYSYWGTKNPFDYFDVTLNVNVSLTLAGSYEYSVNNPEKLKNTILGDKRMLNSDGVHQVIDRIITDEVVVVIASETKVASYFEIYQNKIELANSIKHNLNQKLLEYGLFLNTFVIEGIKLLPGWVLEEWRKLQFAKKTNEVLSEFKVINKDITLK